MKLAILTFTALGTFILVVGAIDHSDRQFMSVDGGDIRYYVGDEIITKEIQVLRYENTEVKLNSRTNFTIKEMSETKLSFFASRGHWIITPDREISSCTRSVCVITTSPIQVRYYTPGEIVEIDTKGLASVKFQEKIYELSAGDRIRIDELTGHTSIQSPSDGIETSSTP